MRESRVRALLIAAFAAFAAPAFAQGVGASTQLQSIPNARDMWELLGATPGVVMSRIDVGGT